MKKTFLAISSIISTIASAQNQVELALWNGDTVRYNTTSVASIDVNDSDMVSIKLLDSSVVDYGYRVKHVEFKKGNVIDDTNAWTIGYSLGLGWNLGNQLESFADGVSSETAWGNDTCTQRTFDKLKEYGFSVIRIPVTWLGHVDEENDYKIDEEWLNYVGKVVHYAKKAGLKAIINMHHDGAESKYWLDIKNAATNEEVNKQVKRRFGRMWRQIAEHFKEEGDYLLFEAFNEIHDGGWGWGYNRYDGGRQYETLNGWLQVFVDSVRAAGYENMNRYLCLPGYDCATEYTINNLRIPNDVVKNRLIVAVHDYDPYDYSIACNYSEWGHTGSNVANYGDENAIVNTFEQLKNKYILNNIPVFIGEFGSAHRYNERQEEFRKYYLEYVVKAARDHGISLAVWDNGWDGTGQEAFGLINHNTGECINNGQDIIDVMVNAYYNDDENYTLESIYNTAP